MTKRIGKVTLYQLSDGSYAVRRAKTRRQTRRADRRERRSGLRSAGSGGSAQLPNYQFRGEALEGDNDMEFEGDDNEFEGDDDSFDGDDDDGIEGDDDGEFGDAGSRLARLEDRWARKGRSNTRHHNRRRSRLQSRVKRQWAKTLISGSTTIGAAGDATVRIRLQHDYMGDEVFFDGSTAGTTIKSISFGDRPVWSAPDGVAFSAFSSTSFMRGLLKGQNISAGLDITVIGTLTGAGTLQVGMAGYKPVQ